LAKTAEASRVPRKTGRTSGVERQAATTESSSQVTVHARFIQLPMIKDFLDMGEGVAGEEVGIGIIQVFKELFGRSRGLERRVLPKTGFGEIQLEGESRLFLWINSWLLGLEISFSL